MRPNSLPPHHLLIAVWGLTGILAENAAAQQGYGAYYQQNAPKIGGHSGSLSPSRYLFDQYFYKRPTVSPYMNLGRPNPAGSTSYHAFVKPEQDRRRQANMARSGAMMGDNGMRVSKIHYPGANQSNGPLVPRSTTRRQPTPYYNQYYGNGLRR